MTRLPRCDHPGQWHHVMHRGIARRTVFESSADIRYFLALLARQVRIGRLEVHAFSVLTTHFHLLVRSPNGDLGLAMGEVLNKYVRRFNRQRRRDGALFRGRFRSRPVTSEAYRRILVRYIDFNPVEAGLVAQPCDYPHGSAYRLLNSGRPPWLERGWFRARLLDERTAGPLDPVQYQRAFGARPDSSLRRLVHRRWMRCPNGVDPLDDLLGAAPPRVADWMMRKAALADGSSIGVPVGDINAVRKAVMRARETGSYRISAVGRSVCADGWTCMENALLRDMCGSTCREIGLMLGKSRGWSWRMYSTHRRLLGDEQYVVALSKLAASVLAEYQPE